MTCSNLLSKALFFDNKLYPKHAPGLTSSQLSRLNPLVKFRDFQATNDMFGFFYYNGGGKAEYKGMFFPKAVCRGAWPKERQVSLVEWSVLQGVTNCLIGGERTLMSYMKRKELLTGEMTILFLLLFNRLA